MAYMIHTLSDRATGEISRFVIAAQGDGVKVTPGEAVTASELLARRLGAPVTILLRPPSPALRVKLDGWRAELGLEPTGDELAAAFFAPTDGAEGR